MDFNRTCSPALRQSRPVGGSGPSITASALSRDTYPVRAGSGVKGVPRQRGVIWTLDAADGSPEWNSGTKPSAVDWTSSLGRIFRADVSMEPAVDQGSSTSHLCGLHDHDP